MARAKEADGTASTNSKPNFMTVLKNQGFRNLWLGQIVSQVGDYFAILATLVVVSGFSSDTQNTTLSMAGMLVASSLPRLLFGMLAGVFVDRWDRRRTMIVSDALRVILALAFIPAFLWHSLWLMYALGFLMATVGTLFNPAKAALIPKLVHGAELTSANALSQTSQMLATFVGPALAGITFKLAGTGNEWVAFAIDSLSFAVSAFAILRIVVPDEDEIEQESANPNARSSALGRMWEEYKIGLRALVLNRTIATIAVTFGITMLGIGAINVLWVTNLKIHFGFDGTELAWRISLGDIAFSAGMVIASIAAGNIFSNLAPKWFIVWGLTGAGLLTMVMGYLDNYWLVVAALFLVGAFVAPINTGVSTLMQIVVPNRQLGRVGGGIGTVVEAATVTSMSLAGVFGAAIGIPFVFFLGGLLCTLAGVLAWTFLPALTLKDKEPEIETIEAAVQAA